MCTLTFVPLGNNDFILTSNRDEAPGRNTLPPQIYTEDGVKLLYPKDAVAGGTWIGVSDRKRAISLMNGGFIPHKRKEVYRMSRGLVLKVLLKASNLNLELSNYNFKDIEPFTAVVLDWQNALVLKTLVWDEEKLHIINEPLIPKIWSSSPLYPGDIKHRREKWFSSFISEKKTVSEKEILQFHKNAGEGDNETNLIMDRGFVRTKSITQLVKNENNVQCRYEDLQSGKIFHSQINL